MLTRRWEILALVAVAAAGVLVWQGCNAQPPRAAADMTFQCESSGNTFVVTGKELDNEDMYAKYFNRAGEAVECTLDSKADAYWVYRCPVEDKYYRYKKSDITSQNLTCPNGHEIPQEDR